MNSPKSVAEKEPKEQLGGRYLTFRLGGERYGIEILKVQEIIQMMPVTPIPRAPGFVTGVINLRGKVIPVIDLRTKFNLPAVSNAYNCIIVVDLGELHMGVIIDAVSEVTNFSKEDIEQVPSFGVALDTAFIRGIGKAKNHQNDDSGDWEKPAGSLEASAEMVYILLDIQAVVARDERDALNAIVAGVPEKGRGFES